MNYQVSVDVDKIAHLQVRLTGLADAHRGQPIEASLREMAAELRDEVPQEWWANQPAALDNRIRNA